MIMKRFLLVMIVCLMASNAFAVLVFNDYSECYNDCPDTTSERSRVNSQCIEQLVVNSAYYFLDSFKHTIEYSQSFEMGQINFSSIEAATSSIIETEILYIAIIEKSRTAPLNFFVINSLCNFDYDQFKERNKLSSEVFEELKGYLKYGNIIGALEAMRIKVTSLKSLLFRLWVSPTNVSLVRELNQRYSNTLLYGQYAAHIFSIIKTY